MPIDLNEYMQNGHDARKDGKFALAKKYYGYGFDRSKSDLNREIFRYWYAYADFKLGYYHLALRNFLITLKNFKLLKKMKDYPYEYYTYYNMAAVYEKLGQWINTKEMLEKALETDYVKENSDNRLIILWYLGDVHREREEFAEAWKCYNEAKDYFKKNGKINHVLNLDIDIAKLQFKEGKIKEPLKLLQSTWKQIISSEDFFYLWDPAAIAIAKIIEQAIKQKIDDPLTLFKIISQILEKCIENTDLSSSELTYLAYLSRLSRLVGKKEIFTRTEEITKDFKPKMKKVSETHSLDEIKDLIQIHLDLGHFYYDQIVESGPNYISFKALDFYKKTDFLVDKATARITSPTLRREFHQQFIDIAYRIFALYQMIYQDYWKDFLYEGLGIIEKYKGYDLFVSLEAARGRREYLNKLSEIEYDIIIKKRYLKKEINSEKRQQLKSEIDDLENKYFDIENEMVTKHTSWITVRDPVELMEETIGIINPLIEYYKFGVLYFAMNENILYVVAFTKKDIQREVIEFDKTELDSMKKLLYSLRDKVNRLSSKSDFIQFDKDLKKLSGWVSENVLTPKVKEILHDLEYLTIIPSGFFINFPLEIIKIDNEYIGIKYKLSREFNLKFLTKQLEDIQWHKRQTKPHLDLLRGEKDVILIGNPNFEEYLVFDKSEIELYAVEKEKVARTEEEYQARRAKGEEVYRENDCWLMDLGKTEVRDIAKLFKKNGIKYNSLVDGEVSKEKLLKLLNNNMKIFHFAGHAVFDNENPQFSQLVLRNSKVMNPPEFQKYSFNQNPLIVFSACESGVSEVKVGDEPFGFLRFTKIMGAQNIIFSLWPVFSDTTTEMMIKFYERLLEGHEIAEAMRYAREQVHNMIENEKGLWFFKGFPLLSWAPFSFIGFPFFAYQKEVLK
ncbi:MAG: CHAT domain-containing tetratricopeptide repeat protein [Promethearchaeota archaeon]